MEEPFNEITLLIQLGVEGVLYLEINFIGNANGYAMTFKVSAADKHIDCLHSSYSLPAATKSSLGGVIVGDGLEIDGNGVLSAINGDIEITVEGGSPVSVKPYTLPTASTVTKGGIKVGHGLYMNGDSLNASSSGGSSSTYIYLADS